MTAPDFLTVEDVELLHSEQLRLFGGLDGVRDRGALESAVAVPASSFAVSFCTSGSSRWRPRTPFTLPRISHSSTEQADRTQCCTCVPWPQWMGSRRLRRRAVRGHDRSLGQDRIPKSSSPERWSGSPYRTRTPESRLRTAFSAQGPSSRAGLLAIRARWCARRV